MALSPGTRLGPYEIVAPLGAGGMGEVWRARDPRLGREVAIKVLPEDVARDPERLRRFEHEARAASAANHPNLLTLYDIGEHEGRRYLVTELLEGRSLREAFEDGSAIDVRTACGWVAQAARGLEAAHAKSLVHRDLKPENLFVCTDGRVKILDFGLAKQSVSPESRLSVAETTAASATTRAGVVLGTVGYMPPEQLRGEPLDQRADLFALGCVLYELLSGRPAFARASVVESIAATLAHEPPALRPISGSGTSLGRLVADCLAKEREQRPTTARELAERLEAIAARPVRTAGARGGTKRAALDSVAVLPFVNEAADPELDYLSEGIAESVLDALTALPKLRVLARSTVMRFEARAGEPLEVGRELDVAAVVTGRLRQRGDTVRVECELVRSADGARVWGRRHERPLGEIAEIGAALAGEIAAQLGRRPAGGAKHRLERRPAASAAAYQAYLRGRYAWNRWTAESMRAAIRHYDEAIALEPLYAQAWAGLADAWAVLGQTKAVGPAEAFPKAKAAATRALELEPDLGEAHASLGFLRRFFDWDWSGSEASFRRALELSPGYATAHRWYGHLCTGLGRHAEALAAVERALELDPLSLVIHTAVGDAHFYARRYDDAIGWYRKALAIDPAFFAGHSDLARALEHAGRIDEAIGEYELAIRMAGGSMADPSAGLANVYAVAGRRAEAVAMVEALEQSRGERYVSPWALASIQARLGNHAEALDWLERAYDEHDSTLVWLAVHPRFDALREAPRFRALLARLKLG